MEVSLGIDVETRVRRLLLVVGPSIGGVEQSRDVAASAVCVLLALLLVVSADRKSVV